MLSLSICDTAWQLVLYRNLVFVLILHSVLTRFFPVCLALLLVFFLGGLALSILITILSAATPFPWSLKSFRGHVGICRSLEKGKSLISFAHYVFLLSQETTASSLSSSKGPICKQSLRDRCFCFSKGIGDKNAKKVWNKTASRDTTTQLHAPCTFIKVRCF
ncbi:Highly reducing polyketide synthase milA [Dirofilaria immitis]